MKLIDKDALVAEIEKWISGWTERLNTNPSNSSFFEGGIEVGKHILSFIDTLEVKEVDLNEYINKYFKGWYVDLTDQGNILHTPDGNAGLMSVKEVAKHFFELGMSVSNKAQKGEGV